MSCKFINRKIKVLQLIFLLWLCLHLFLFSSCSSSNKNKGLTAEENKLKIDEIPVFESREEADADSDSFDVKGDRARNGERGPRDRSQKVDDIVGREEKRQIETGKNRAEEEFEDDELAALRNIFDDEEDFEDAGGYDSPGEIINDRSSISDEIISDEESDYTAEGLEPGTIDVPNEPACPVLSFRRDPARAGIKDRNTGLFFKVLESGRFTYRYRSRVESKMLSDIKIVMNGSQAFLSINSGKEEKNYIKPEASTIYLLNNQDKTARLLPADNEINTHLSSYAFKLLAKNAQEKLYITGKGSVSDFAGGIADFEEFSSDGMNFIRYYFRYGSIVGHKAIYADGSIAEVEIAEFSDSVSEEAFKLPADYTIMN